jgi:hypothetical protein
LRPDRAAYKLSQEHIEFLTSYSTLEKWAGWTLKWRTKLFHRIFPDKRIAVTTLRRLYLKHGIKRKKVRQEKYMPLSTRQRFTSDCQDLLSKLDLMKRENKKIVYLDEINFTKRSLSLREWSNRGSNLSVDQKDVYTGYKSVIASMTAENGIGCTTVHSQAINSLDFVYFLQKLRRKHVKRSLALFMDNLKVHKSIEV